MTGIKIKTLKFDARPVLSAAERGNRKALAYAGGYARKVMRSLLGRKTKKISAPGEPPNTHSAGARTLKLIFFDYDPATRSEVIGPIKLAGGDGQAVPGLLDRGGNVARPAKIITVTNKRGRARTIRFKARTQNYRPHPFVGPTREKAVGKFPEFWNRAIVP